MQESPPAGYTYGVLDAPELPRTPLPAPAAVAAQEEAPTPFPTSVAASTPLATPEREGNFAGAPLQAETGTPGSALIIGIGPSFLLVLLSLIVVLWRVSVHSRMR